MTRILRSLLLTLLIPVGLFGVFLLLVGILKFFIIAWAFNGFATTLGTAIFFAVWYYIWNEIY